MLSFVASANTLPRKRLKTFKPETYTARNVSFWIELSTDYKCQVSFFQSAMISLFIARASRFSKTEFSALE